MTDYIYFGKGIRHQEDLMNKYLCMPYKFNLNRKKFNKCKKLLLVR